MRRHPSWKTPEPEWVTLGPGVRWRLIRPDGAVQAMVSAEVAAVMGQVYQGLAGLQTLGLDPEQDLGPALSVDRLPGYATVLTANLYARRILSGWEGMETEDGATPDFTDPEAIHSALVFGPPDTERPLLAPFMAWLEGPQRPMAAERRRLRALAKDHWSGGAERCSACVMESSDCAKGAPTEGELCPRLAHAPETPEGQVAWSIAQGASGLWIRAGMAGQVTGLDYGSALLAYEDQAGTAADVGAAYAAFRAIESGRLEAEAERAEAERANRETSDHG